MDRDKFFSLPFLSKEENISMTLGNVGNVCPVNNLETMRSLFCFPRHFQGRDFARRRCIVRWSGREFVAPCTPTAPNFQADACIIPWLEKLVL